MRKGEVGMRPPAHSGLKSLRPGGKAEKMKESGVVLRLKGRGMDRAI